MKLHESGKRRIRCGELGEDRLIAQLVGDWSASSEVIAGPGDDCAVLAGPGKDEFLLLKTDCVVEGVHFLPDERPARVGWKAMMRALSDFAAMAGEPRYAVITLITPAEREVRWLTQLYRGLKRAAARFRVAIVGGETSGTNGPVTISVSVAGSVEKDRCVFRHGGKAGDILFVSGELGGAGKARHLDFVPRIEEARWLTRHFPIHAMMDLSDGLGTDLPRLARASGLAFQLDLEALPRARGTSLERAISEGEDYELLFAVAPAEAAGLSGKWRKKFPRVRLTQIGVLEGKSRIRMPALPHGFVHFE